MPLNINDKKYIISKLKESNYNGSYVDFLKQFPDGGKTTSRDDSLKLYNMTKGHDNEGYSSLSYMTEIQKRKYVDELNKLFPNQEDYMLSKKTNIMPEGVYAYDDIPGLKFKKPSEIIEQKKFKPEKIPTISYSSMQTNTPSIVNLPTTNNVWMDSSGKYTIHDNYKTSIKGGFKTREEANAYWKFLQTPKHLLGGFSDNTTVNNKKMYLSGGKVENHDHSRGYDYPTMKIEGYDFGGRTFVAESNHPNGSYYVNGKLIPKYYFGGPVAINRKEKEQYERNSNIPII